MQRPAPRVGRAEKCLRLVQWRVPQPSSDDVNGAGAGRRQPKHDHADEHGNHASSKEASAGACRVPGAPLNSADNAAEHVLRVVEVAVCSCRHEEEDAADEHHEPGDAEVDYRILELFVPRCACSCLRQWPSDEEHDFRRRI